MKKIEELFKKAESLWVPGNKTKDYIKIANIYSEIYSIDPHYHNILERRADAWYHGKEYDKAIDDLNNCLKNQPDSYRYIWRRAQIEYDKGDLRAALGSCSKYLARNEDNYYTRELRAQIYRKMGCIKEAETDEVIVKKQKADEQIKLDDPNHKYHLM